jgi:hypothetical protein
MYRNKSIARDRSGNNRGKIRYRNRRNLEQVYNQEQGKEQEKGAETGIGTMALTNSRCIILAYLSEDSSKFVPLAYTNNLWSRTLKNKAGFPLSLHQINTLSMFPYFS